VLGRGARVLYLAGAAAVSLPAGGRAQPADDSLRQFTVFFERNSHRISADGLRVIDQAAGAARREAAAGRLDHVKVTGHADATGRAAASQRMSERRAGAVRDALVERGVPGDRISTEGRGRAEPAVAATRRPDEPRNRRARIVIYRPGE
jgi:OmpA-OmpF porin, OOP family